jgi:hypothetical protein
LLLQSGESRALEKTSWTIEREEHLQDAAYDAYVEVGFGDTAQLFSGDHVELYQQMLTGDPSSSLFDQRANYSFTDQPNVPWLHLTLYYQGKLLWGLEPPPIHPRACLARAVNLNGPALAIAGRSFQSATDAQVTSNGTDASQPSAPFPPASVGVTTLLQTVTSLQAGSELQLPTENATYLVYLYATSLTNDENPSTFTLQGSEPDLTREFRSQTADGGQAWARMGPFRVDVTTGTLTLGVTGGTIAFAGIELWYPE